MSSVFEKAPREQWFYSVWKHPQSGLISHWKMVLRDQYLSITYAYIYVFSLALLFGLSVNPTWSALTALCTSDFPSSVVSFIFLAQHCHPVISPGEKAHWVTGLQSWCLWLGTQYDLTARETQRMVFSIAPWREPTQTPITLHHALTKRKAWHHQKTPQQTVWKCDLWLGVCFLHWRSFGLTSRGEAELSLLLSRLLNGSPTVSLSDFVIQTVICAN